LSYGRPLKRGIVGRLKRAVAPDININSRLKTQLMISEKR
jgi:hypothetical protein